MFTPFASAAGLSLCRHLFPSSGRAYRGRAWSFVLRNYSVADLVAIDTWISSSCTFVICIEDFDCNAMPYLRGLVYFKNPVRLFSVSILNVLAEWSPLLFNRSGVLAAYLADSRSTLAGQLPFHSLPADSSMILYIYYARAGKLNMIPDHILIKYYHSLSALSHLCNKDP